jgi:hypothetical protein
MASNNNGGIFNLGSASSAQFTLLGGRYAVSVIATFNGGSVDLQALGPDLSTFLSVLNSAFTTNGNAIVYLPGGQYKWVVVSATVSFAAVSPVRETIQ